VRAEGERSQSLNRETAWAALRARLKEEQRQKQAKERESTRKGQVGSGMRGDKRRTIRMQDDQVVDHVLNKKMKASKYIRGQLEHFYD
jgi:peptide chain release factor 1